MPLPGLLRFHETYFERIWGGTLLRDVLGLPTPEDKVIGEAWLVSDHPHCESVVLDGPLAGATLRQLVSAHGEELLGRAAPTPHGRFPLLLKLIDAGDLLSVQVHPDDDDARRLGEPDVGKTEMWHVLHAASGANLICGIKPGIDREAFEAAVQRAAHHIEAGDVFQLVLSQRLESRIARDPFDLYLSLRMVNPSPYMAFFDFGDWHLIGSSPEVMVKAEPMADGSGRVKASLRPIAGTRPRGDSEEQDRALEADLLADPKERAEHVMLVDLGRNDLGRVCQPGTVAVSELMVIERYSHVMHIVSEVEGVLDPQRDVWDLLMASFPAGTVSGAPKIRAMQLIHALEPDARGPYSGVYGAMDLSGALNTAITIRTMVVLPAAEGGWRVQVQAGAGLVADSVPASEFQETLNKARGMLKALACLA